MKSDIHPKFNQTVKVTCTCGNTFETGSTQEEITVDICSQCHPFFTGEMKFIDTQGRVEKFKAKQEAAQTYQGSSKKNRDKSKAEAKSLKEMMQTLKQQSGKQAAKDNSKQ